jgi:hypothetical protein
MTSDEMRALADRVVACRHFRVMPGMRDLQGRTWTPDLLWRWLCTVDRPDLSDPATLGCLLALVREAWGEPRTAVVPLSGDRWGVAIPNVLRQSPAHKGATEAEALVAALEAATDGRSTRS